MQPTQPIGHGTSPGSPVKDDRTSSIGKSWSRSHFKDVSPYIPLVDDDPNRRLEREFERVKFNLEGSQASLKQTQIEVSAERARNSDLKQKAADLSPRVTAFDAESDRNNYALEARLHQLEAELVAVRLQHSTQIQPKMTAAGEQVEAVYSQVSATNFLHRNQTEELRHLTNMLAIFEEENARLKELCNKGHKPSDADIAYIKANIEKVRREIDEILRTRATLNQRFKDQEEQILRLRSEDNRLKTESIGRVSSTQTAELIDQLNQRNQQIAELNRELARVRSQQVSPSHQGGHIEQADGRRQLERQGQALQDQQAKLDELARHCSALVAANGQMKAQLEKVGRLDVAAIARELEATRSRARQLEADNERLRASPGLAAANRLEEDNVRLQLAVRDLSDKLAHAQQAAVDTPRTLEPAKDPAAANVNSSPARPVATVKKRMGDEIDDFLLSERMMMGEVSYDEMLKLEDRIKEFGDCNIELEELIYKLKSKIVGTEYKPREFVHLQNYDSGTSEKKLSSRESERLQKMICDLTVQVDRLTQVSPVKGAHTAMAPELLNQIETVVSRTRQGEEVSLRLLNLQKGQRQLGDELSDLKDRYRQLEIKHNTLISVNIQNEAHIERLIAQIQDNKEYFKKLIGENESLKSKEKDAAQELATYFKQNSELHDNHNNALRQKAALQHDYDNLHGQLLAYQSELSRLRSDIDAFTK